MSPSLTLPKIQFSSQNFKKVCFSSLTTNPNKIKQITFEKRKHKI